MISVSTDSVSPWRAHQPLRHPNYVPICFSTGGFKNQEAGVGLLQFTMQLISVLDVTSKFHQDVVLGSGESGEAQSLPCEVLPQRGRLVRQDVDGGAQRLAGVLVKEFVFNKETLSFTIHPYYGN